MRTREDGFEYRVKRILEDLHKEYLEQKADDEDSENFTFTDYLYQNPFDVMNAFIDDVDSYCGIENLFKEK